MALAGELAEEVAGTLHDRGGGARTVTVKLRSGSFDDVTRSRTLDAPTDEVALLVSVAHDLARVAHGALDAVPVRLVGTAVSGLSDATQTTLDLE